MRRAIAGVLGLVILAGGYAFADVLDKVPGVLTRDLPAPVPPPGVLPVAAATAEPLGPLAATAEVPTPEGLAAQVAAALGSPALGSPALGSSVGVDVRDAQTGISLLARDVDTPRSPASTAKLLTAAAVLAAMDPRATLATKVVRGAADEVVLVAGGDTMLARGRGRPAATEGRAGLADLAAQVAARLKEGGTASVRLRLDTSYAAGEPYAPGWNMADVSAGYTQGVFMVGLAGQRPRPLKPSPRDPARELALAFVKALAAKGITARLEPEEGWGKRVDAGAEVLGKVESAPLVDILSMALDDSDNALTENLARQLAVHLRKPATFAAAAEAVREGVERLGIDLGSAHLVDTSGLSAGQRLPVRALAEVLALATSGRLPALRGVLAELPVAGLDGTLHDRFLTGPTHRAAGLARAKTGTLTGVSALAGTVVDASGRLLSFAVVADRVPGGPAGTLPARAALDRFVAALATCGCG